MATRAKPATPARECRKIFMPALGVGAGHPGKAFVQVSTSQVFLDHLVHLRPKEPILLLTMLIIDSFHQLLSHQSVTAETRKVVKHRISKNAFE